MLANGRDYRNAHSPLQCGRRCKSTPRNGAGKACCKRRQRGQQERKERGRRAQAVSCPLDARFLQQAHITGPFAGKITSGPGVCCARAKFQRRVRRHIPPAMQFREARRKLADLLVARFNTGNLGIQFCLLTARRLNSSSRGSGVDGSRAASTDRRQSAADRMTVSVLL